jgi:hypothetical protein
LSMLAESVGAERLYPLLRWESPDSLHLLTWELRRKHLEFVATQLNATLRNSRGEQGSQLLGRLSTLSDDSVARILGAPETCSVVCTHGDDFQRLIAYVDTVITAEELRENTDTPAPKEVWSALGDYRFDKGRRGPAYRAKRVGGFVLDLDSPYRRPPLIESSFRPKFGPLVPFSLEERALVERRIVAAVEGLQDVSLAAINLSTSMVRTVMPRIDPVNQTYKGSSNRGMVGRINLFNPHLEHINHAVIATSLVHESIHILLYLFEQQASLVDDERGACEILITSPWSGTQVHLLAIVHAAFVWYGILHLWYLPDVEKYFPHREIEYYRNFCARGLRDGRLTAALGSHKSKVRSDVLEELGEMEASAHSIIRSRAS